MRYILATDGSQASLKAARFFAARLCPGSEDEVFVIYVFPLPVDAECYRGVVELPTGADDERVRRVALPVLERTAELLGQVRGRVEQVVLVGNPAQEIVEFAMNLHVDLIVAGTHGRSPARELYLGSVSRAVVHRAMCSVLVVR